MAAKKNKGQAKSQALLDTKEEYMTHLGDLLSDALTIEIKEIYKLAKESSSVLKTFQDGLAATGTWNALQINELYDRVHSQSKCEYFQDLIKSILIVYVKIHMMSHGVEDSKGIKMRVPSNSDFVHRCLVSCARSIWKRPYLFYHNVPSIERRTNMNEVDAIIRKCFSGVVRSFLPFDELLHKSALTTSDPEPAPSLSAAADAKAEEGEDDEEDDDEEDEEEEDEDDEDEEEEDEEEEDDDEEDDDEDNDDDDDDDDEEDDDDEDDDDEDDDDDDEDETPPTPQVPVQTPQVPIQTQQVPVQTPQVSVQTQQVPVQTPQTQQVPVQTPQVSLQTPQTPQVPVQTPQTPQVPVQTPQVPVQTSQVPVQTSQVPVQTPQVPAYAQLQVQEVVSVSPIVIPETPTSPSELDEVPPTPRGIKTIDLSPPTVTNDNDEHIIDPNVKNVTIIDTTPLVKKSKKGAFF